MNIILFTIKSDYLNSNYIETQLIQIDNWAFHYFIPNFETVNNLNILVVGYFKEKPLNHSLFIEYTHAIEDPSKILNILINNIMWNAVDLNTHSCVWLPNSESAVGDYLDLISGGLSIFLPQHWGFSYKHVYFLLKKTFKIDLDFLKDIYNKN